MIKRLINMILKHPAGNYAIIAIISIIAPIVVIIKLLPAGSTPDTSIKYQTNTTLEKRIECMSKTLMIVYGISKWEAHYYSIMFNDFSKQYNIPWEIYPAVMRIESNFKTTLISSKQARGIMQVLEPTAKAECAILEIEYVEGQTLWNEVCNITIGCSYLSRMITQKGLEGGVRSYLGGPQINIKAMPDSTKQYVSEYKTSVWKEFKGLTYTFRGIVAESGLDYKQMHVGETTDTLRINTKLF